MTELKEEYHSIFKLIYLQSSLGVYSNPGAKWEKWIPLTSTHANENISAAGLEGAYFNDMSRFNLFLLSKTV